GSRLLAHNGVSSFGIWDYSTQRQLLKLTAYVGSDPFGTFRVTLSPDETKLAASKYGHPFQIFDARTGQLLETLTVPAQMGMPPPGPAIYAPDGKLLCLLPRNRHFELWDLKARRVVAILDPQSDDPRAAQPFDPVGHLFSPDGKRYYLPTEDFRIRVWEY